MLMYLLLKAILVVLIVPVDLGAWPVNAFLGLQWVSANPEIFTSIAPHGGVVSSSSPVAVLFSSMGIANTFLPVREWFLFVLPFQVIVLSITYTLMLVRFLLRFVPFIHA